MRIVKLILLLIIIAAGFILQQPIMAQNSIQRSVIGSGNTELNSSNYRMNGTIGQTVIGIISNSNNIIISGFWSEVFGTTRFVTNNANAGFGSLRQAILDANSNPGLNEIYFSISGSGPHTIQPLSPLPPITDPVIIDGTTQQGFAGAPIIELDGSLIGEEVNGLEITAGNSIIRGLVINQFGGSGIVLSGNGDNLIEGNYIGTDVNGSTARGNGWIGVSIFESSNNTVGGAAIGASIGVRNIISGNSFNGVQIEGAAATGNVVAGNYIGLAANGTDPLGNGGMGVRIYQAYRNTIGGPNPGEGNVVSDNGWDGPDFPWHGIHIAYCDATSSDDGNIIQGNYVGTDYTGMLGRGNDNFGILMFYSSYTRVIDNVVADNRYGVVVWGNDAELSESPRPSADYNVIIGNLIGTDATGINALGNELGLYIRRGHNNTVGGTSDELRNIISGNSNCGVMIGRGGASGNNVWGNYIGLDINGEALGNGYGQPEGTGLEVFDATGNFIGGPNPGEANVISGNIGYGILIERDVETTTENFIQGNFIGTNPAGSEIIGNTKSGIKILDASNNQIGGADPSKGNLISGNGGYGILLVGAESKYNKIFGNKIGIMSDGTGALPNTSDGVCVDWDFDANGDPIGAANNTEIYLNQIAYNGGNGVSIRHGENNKIVTNKIYLNDGLGIDLGNDGVTSNDSGDGDIGPNNLQNFPVLSNAYSTWGDDNSITTTVDISINSTPETQFSLQIFKNDECDPSGFGEGKTHILNKNITTDLNGDGWIEGLTINAQSGDYITATARDPQNNTSEFSQCIPVSWLTFSSTSTVDQGETETSETYIPDGMSSATFSSQWPGSDVVMTLITPSGSEIKRDDFPEYVEHENGLTYEYYIITDPEAGDWTVELLGAVVSGDGEEVSLTVTGAPTQPMQTMVVDIKPEDDNNVINCKNMNGVITVAILITDEFDATTIDHTTVRFGKYGSEAAETHVKKKTGEVERHEEDVDNDGDMDLVFHFKYGETNLGCDDEFAVLTGSTYDGIFFTGADKVHSASNNKSVQNIGGNNAIPAEFALKQPYPNPFNPTTTINYALPKPSKVIITIYDIRGRKVRELINNNESAGYKSIIWDGLDDYGKMVSGGIYIYHLKAGQYSSSKKLLFLK